MAANPYKPRLAGSLKAAALALVTACGGPHRAAEFARIGRTQLFRATDDADEHAQVHLPAVVVAVLERVAGTPIVTRLLAASAGCVLLDVGRAASALDRDMAAVVAEVADVFRRYGEARAAQGPGGAELTPAERGRLIAEIHDALAALAAVLADLDGAVG